MHKPNIHDAMDLIDKIELQGGPHPMRAAEYAQIKNLVLTVGLDSNPGNDLGDYGGGNDELGAWPWIVAQLAGIAALGYVGWKIAEPVVAAAKLAGPVVTYGTAVWALWFLFRDDITGRPRKGFSYSKTTYGRPFSRKRKKEVTYTDVSSRGGGDRYDIDDRRYD